MGPIASVFGYIMDFLFRITSSMGIMNIGLCIILFTIHKVTVISSDDQTAGIVKTYVAYEP